MKKLFIILLLLISSFSAFAGFGQWIKNKTVLEAGLLVEYNPVGKDLYNTEALKDVNSYRFGFVANAGIKYTFLENRITCDRLKKDLIHFTDRVSLNLALPLPYVTPFVGYGINLTLGQSYENGPFYLGIDDIRLKNIGTLATGNAFWNLALSRFINFGIKVSLPKNINITTNYSIMHNDFVNNCSSYSELFKVLNLGQAALSVTYSFL